MSLLLVQSCSKSKNKLEEPVPALELYSGFFFKIIKKAIREDDFDSNIDLRILSAEHGIIDTDTKIEWYDRRMNKTRAEELAPSVQTELLNDYSDDEDDIVINAGETYRRSLKRVDETIDSNIYYIRGGGIGEKGNVLKRLIRGRTDVRTDPAITTNTSK